MVETANRCADCGRRRWDGDRYCAQCGGEFAVGHDAAPPSGGVLDLDGLTGEDSEATTARSNWRDGLRGLAVIGFVLLLLVGGLYLASSSEGDPAPEEVADEDREQPLVGERDEPLQDPDLTPVPPTPEPSPEPTEEDRAEPTPRPTRAPVPAAVGEALMGLDVGAEWLIAKNLVGRVVAHNLTTGEVHEAATSHGATGETTLLRTGEIKLDFFGESTTTFRRFDAPDEPLELSGSFVGSFVDRAVGQVIITTTNSANELLAVAVETEAHKTLDLESTVVSPSALFFGPFGDGADATNGPAFVVTAQGETWGWTWSDGWGRIANGDVQHIGSGHLVVRTCEGPDQCEFAIVDYDGELLVETIQWGNVPWASLSPDGTTIAALNLIRLWEPPNDMPVLSVTNAVSGESFDLEIEMVAPAMRWSPNGRYLTVGGYGPGSVVDVVEQRIVATYDVSPGERQASFVFTDDFELPQAS